MFKVATWNVNSLRVRLPQVLEWLSVNKPDVLGLQEIKLPDEDFPIEEINAAGYNAIFSGQKTYNGVAILSKIAARDSIKDFLGFEDPQRRVLAATVDKVRIINLYVPNGESVISEKYHYKLTWLTHLKNFLESELKQHEKIIVMGDFNVAPTDMDVHDPIAWEGKVLCSSQERNAFKEILDLGFKDCFHLHAQPEKSFSWWDYRLNAFKRNMGLRIDHILATDALAPQCMCYSIDKITRANERPSDHAVVVAEFHLVS